jgi:hypothetical protein
LAKDDGKALQWYQYAADQDYEAPQRDLRPGDLWERARAVRAQKQARGR